MGILSRTFCTYLNERDESRQTRLAESFLRVAADAALEDRHDLVMEYLTGLHAHGDDRKGDASREMIEKAVDALSASDDLSDRFSVACSLLREVLHRSICFTDKKNFKLKGLTLLVGIAPPANPKTLN